MLSNLIPRRKITIHFHVGAHKTATTYMQSRLRCNRQRLRRGGVDFVDLWANGPEERLFRKEFKRLLEGDTSDEDASRVSTRLRNILESRRTKANRLVVVSYENALGDYDLTKSANLYPGAGKAALVLAETFPDWRLKIFLSLRSLDRFLESGYLQRILTRRESRSFRRYLSQIDVAGMSWVPVVRAISAAVGSDNLFVWGYENFIVDERQIWNLFLARQDSETLLVRPARRSNHSISLQGLKYMRRINKVVTRRDARRFRAFLQAHFASPPGADPIALLDNLTRQQLILNYEQDRREIPFCINSVESYIST